MMSIKEKYALTDEGVRNVLLGAVWTTVTNLVVFASVGFVYVIMSALVARLTGGAVELGPWGALGFDPLAVPAAGWAAAIAAYLIVLFVCERLAYHYQYGVIYQESGRQRIGPRRAVAQAAALVLGRTRPRGPHRDAHGRRGHHRARLQPRAPRALRRLRHHGDRLRVPARL